MPIAISFINHLASPNFDLDNIMAATQKKPEELEKARALNHVPWSDEYEKMISGMLYVTLLNGHNY